MAFSPDGKTLAAYVDGNDNDDVKDDTIRIWDLKTHKETMRLKMTERGRGKLFAYTPGGDLVISRENRVQVLDVKKKVIREIRPKNLSCWNAVLSEDGKTLAIGHDRIEVYDLPSGRLVHTLKFAEKTQKMSISADGRWLASSHEKNQILFWDLRTGKSTGTLKVGTNPIGCHSLALTPDGKKVLVDMKHGYAFELFDRATRKSEKVLELTRRYKVAVNADRMTFSADGKTVYFAGEGHGVGIFVWDITKDVVRGNFQRKPGAFYTSTAVSPDRKMVATGFRDIKLWDITKPMEKPK